MRERLQKPTSTGAPPHIPAVQQRRTFAETQHQPRVPITTPPIALEVLQTSGQPLDTRTRTRMEKHFGHSFAHVRIHTDRQANDATDALGAEAYTAGSDIVFAAGLTPGNLRGEEVLIHELAHVVATDRTGVMIDPSRITPADHPSERQASEVSRAPIVGPLTTPPVGLALRRKGAPHRLDQAESDIDDVYDQIGALRGEVGLLRESAISTKRDATINTAATRLLRIQGYIDKAIVDFERNARVPEDKIAPYYTFLTTTLIPATIQTIRVALLDTPYPEGRRAPGTLILRTPKDIPTRAGGALHLAATSVGVALQLAITLGITYANEHQARYRREAYDKAESLTITTEFAFSKIIEALNQTVRPTLETVFRENTQLLDPAVSTDDILDTLGFPSFVNARAYYEPIRFMLEVKFTQWLIEYDRGTLLPGLFRGLDAVGRFKALSAARARARADTIARYGEQH